MSVDWGMAAVAASLSVFVAPIVWNGVTTQVRKMCRSGRRVKQLKWDDIPDGALHHCRYPSESHSFLLSPPHSKREKGSLSCILANIFNRAWNKSSAHPRFLPEVPNVLPTTSSFLCTEARVILAFALLAETSVDTLVTCNRIEDILICQISGSHHKACQFRPSLSKFEVQSLLEGYPPWYRETFTTKDKFNLAFPISDAQDISRGGWIVAVGLMNLELDTQKPLCVYRCPNEPAEPEWRGNGRTFRMAIVRCRDHIARHILPHFGDDSDVKAALCALDYLIKERTGSGMPWGSFDRNELMPPMKASDCRFVMQHFNNYSALIDPADVARYAGVMMPTMSAVVHGAFEVVQYLKDHNVAELKIPPELANLQQEIYLKIDI